MIANTFNSSTQRGRGQPTYRVLGQPELHCEILFQNKQHIILEPKSLLGTMLLQSDLERLTVR